MRGRADVSSFIDAFAGSHRFVLDYLAEEVLQQLPDENAPDLRSRDACTATTMFQPELGRARRSAPWVRDVQGGVVEDIAIELFEVSVDERVLTDLRQRIARTCWPNRNRPGWQDGADVGYIRELVATWADGFDWRAQERELNALRHHRATIDGQRIHFVQERGHGPDPLPIVLTHGFPSSFVEHLPLLPLLTDPAAHGGRADDAFDVVITSLPGYGFSDPMTGPWLEPSVADLWCRLMRDGLGYERFGAHGSDIGSGVTIELGRRHPDHLIGIHLSAFYLDTPPEPWPSAVHRFIETSRRERAPDTAYSRLQSTRPQTLAHGLSDSPAGLAAWIIDLFRTFSDCGGDVESRFTRDVLLTNLTIYWATGSIASALRPYYDWTNAPHAPSTEARVEVPSGFAVFADSWRPGSIRTPRQLAEPGFNVTRWTEMPRGGHFAALEEPHLLADEIRAFFRPLRHISH